MKKTTVTIIAILILLAAPIAYGIDGFDDGWVDDFDDGWSDDFDDDWADDFDDDWSDDFDNGWTDDFDDGWPDDFDNGWTDDFDDGWPDDFDDDADDSDDDGTDDNDFDDGPDDEFPETILHVESITGKRELNIGDTQLLKIEVEDQNENDISGAIVTVYYTKGGVFGTCVTDDGVCYARKQMNTAGEYRIFAHAWKFGNTPDADSYPIFSFEVLDNRGAPYFVSKPVTTGYRDVEYSYDADAIDPDGDKITYSLINGPTGMKVNPTNGLVSWMPAEKGSYDVVLRAEDESGAYDEQSYELVVGEEGTSFRLGDLVITKLRVASDEYLEAGEQLIVSMNLENDGSRDLENLKITASVLELSIRDSQKFDLEGKEETSTALFLAIPEHADANEYGLRVEIQNNNLRRVIYRDFFVIE